MKKLENQLDRLQKYVGKTFTPRNNGVFAIDTYHNVRIVSIDRLFRVHYTYVHRSRTGCTDRTCPLVCDSFSQSVTHFFSYVDWKGKEGDDKDEEWIPANKTI